MRYFILIFFLMATPLISMAQSSSYSYQISTGYSYLQHSKLHGLFIDHNIVKSFPKKNAGIALGFSLNYGEGNRNFDRNIEGAYSMEFENSYPLGLRTLNSTYFKEFKAKTSATYQVSTHAGGLKSWDLNEKTFILEGGMFWTYINKAYIANIIYDANISLLNSPQDVFHLVIPFQLRYYNLGFYINPKFILLKRKHWSVGFESDFNLGIDGDFWMNTGIIMNINM